MSEGDVAYLPSLAAQEAAYWEARRQRMNLNDKQIGDLLRAAAPHLIADAQRSGYAPVEKPDLDEYAGFQR